MQSSISTAFSATATACSSFSFILFSSHNLLNVLLLLFNAPFLAFAFLVVNSRRDLSGAEGGFCFCLFFWHLFSAFSPQKSFVRSKIHRTHSITRKYSGNL